MVNQTSNTLFVAKHIATQPSFKRWLRHACSVLQVKRYFSRKDQEAIAAAVHQAEQGHVGEIQVVIEGHIPSSLAYHLNTRQRAQQLFAELGVWDTEHNSGVLLYLNLCEKTVEIVVDRGVQGAAEQEGWEKICQQMILLLKTQQYLPAVLGAIAEVAQVLQCCQQHDDDDHNELPDQPIILK